MWIDDIDLARVASIYSIKNCCDLRIFVIKQYWIELNWIELNWIFFLSFYFEKFKIKNKSLGKFHPWVLPTCHQLCHNFLLKQQRRVCQVQVQMQCFYFCLISILTAVLCHSHKPCIGIDMLIQEGRAGESQLFWLENLIAEMWKIVNKINNWPLMLFLCCDKECVAYDR